MEIINRKELNKRKRDMPENCGYFRIGEHTICMFKKTDPRGSVPQLIRINSDDEFLLVTKEEYEIIHRMNESPLRWDFPENKKLADEVKRVTNGQTNLEKIYPNG